MSDQPAIPHRRHRLELKLEADDIQALLSALASIEYDLLVKERDHDWAQPIDITSGGYDSGWHLHIDSDLTIDGDAYRASLKDWSAANRAARRGECPSCHTPNGRPHTDYCQAPNLTAEVDEHCHRCEGAGCRTCIPEGPLHVMSCDECGADLDARPHFIGCTREEAKA